MAHTFVAEQIGTVVAISFPQDLLIQLCGRRVAGADGFGQVPLIGFRFGQELKVLDQKCFPAFAASSHGVHLALFNCLHFQNRRTPFGAQLPFRKSIQMS